VAIVPGCGAGYDVLTLASPERRVVGIDVVEIARERFEKLRSAAGVAEERASVVVGDLFAWEPPAPVDLWWDYTFLCALDPRERTRWADKVDATLAAGGELVALLFPVDPTRPSDEGPPFTLDPDEVVALLAPRFEPTELRPARESHPKRSGREWLARFRRRS
jgi:hypothetical protein